MHGEKMGPLFSEKWMQEKKKLYPPIKVVYYAIAASFMSSSSWTENILTELLQVI